MRGLPWTLLVIPLALGGAEPHAFAGRRSPPAQLSPPRPYELFFEVGKRSGRSKDGEYSFQLEGPGEKILIVRQRRVKRPLAHIDLSRSRDPVVRFVGGHNLLASWGCGTYCEVTLLYSPRGRKLAPFGRGAHEVSPGREPRGRLRGLRPARLHAGRGRRHRPAHGQDAGQLEAARPLEHLRRAVGARAGHAGALRREDAARDPGAPDVAGEASSIPAVNGGRRGHAARAAGRRSAALLVLST